MIEFIYLAIIYTFILGSLYLGIALGFSIITGILRVFHLAYPVLFLIAAYGTWMFWKDVGAPFLASVVLSFALVAILTPILYKFVISKFIEAEDYLLTALLLVFLLTEELINLVYPEWKGVYLPTLILPGTVTIGIISVSGQLLITAVTSIVMVAIYVAFFVKTKTGLIMRAVSQDYFAAKIMGINFDRVFIIALFIGSIPPGVVMLLMSPVWALNPFIGWTLFTFGIMVAVLGGLGNLKGTIIAAYIVGSIHAFVGFLIDPRLMNLASLIVVVAILTFKPRGLARAETIW